MTIFGASVYLPLASKQELINYFELLAKYQIKFIFTSLITFKKEEKENWEKLALISSLAKKYYITIFADINENLLEELVLIDKKPKYLINFFLNKGISGLRCDDSISLALQAKLSLNSNHFKVILNGSYNILQLEELILDYKINKHNLVSCYNFYPQRYTGASVDFYLINQYESHINNIPFIGFATLLGKEYYGSLEYDDSLPSLELHRNWPLETQIHHFIALGTDCIFLANQFIKEKDLILLNKIDQEKITLEVEIISDISNEEKIILFDENIHFVKLDLSQDVIRSTSSKVAYQDLNIKVRNYKPEYFDVGDIVILNQNSKDNERELQVVIKKIKNDGIRNLVAKVKEPYCSYFLSELKATRKFKFIS